MLEKLQAQHPLPGAFEVVDSLTETTTVGSLRIELVGLVASDGEASTTGSAAAIGELPFERGYYELYERCAVSLAQRSGAQYPLLDEAGECQLGLASAEQMFPVAGRDQRVSASNGVAVGRDFLSAARRAKAELVERDVVLRSWYGGLQLHAACVPTGGVSDALASEYELHHRCGARAGITVSVTLGLPRGAQPLLLGFGASVTPEAAQEKAMDELVQRLGFLWGEEIPASSPEFSPSPDFHQEYYLWPGAHEKLRSWFSRGSVVARRDADAEDELEAPLDVSFVDLTPPGAPAGIVVVRAVSAACWPLVFGRWAPPGVPFESHGLHPIC